MDFAKQARIVDPEQIARLPPRTSLPFPPFLTHDQVVHSGEWGLYRESIEAYSANFDCLQWWETRAPWLPIMYRYALRTLAIPHTSCGVECSFLVWKRVRSVQHAQGYSQSVCIAHGGDPRILDIPCVGR